MVLNKEYTLPVGHMLTVTVRRGSVHVVRLDDPTTAALVSSSAVYGPYALEKTFRVQDEGNVNVAIAESDFAANTPSADEKAMLDAVPVEDQEDGSTVYADEGVLKVSSAP